jgi:hypothetical protein
MAQYAIVKQKTKAQSCAGYVSNIVSGDTKLYFYFGNPVPWSIYPAGTYSDTSPPAPTDTPFVEKQIWDGIIGMKRVTSSDVKTAFARVNWVSGNYYDMYRDDYDGATVNGVSLVGEYVNTKPLSLARSNSLVLVDDSGTYKLYRCVDNRSSTTGNPLASTTKPTFTVTSIQTLADGYRWKFMGELSSTDVYDYMTSSHCPIPTQASTATNSGQILSVVMTSRGSGYTSTPTVTVKGDGTGLTLGTPVIVAGAIVYIPVTSAGTGYTYATVTISGGGSPTATATARAILAPQGGIGGSVAALIDQIEPNFMIARLENSDTDQHHTTRGNAKVYYATDGIPDLRYRSIGLLENPYTYGTTTVASSTLLQNFSEYRYNATLGTVAYADRYTTSTSGLLNPVLTVVSSRENTATTAAQLSFNAATAVNSSTNILTYNTHNLLTGDSVLYDNNGGTSVGGLTHNNTYYVIRINANEIKIATSLANATAGSAIAITTGVGSSHSLTTNVVKNYVGVIRTTEQLIEPLDTTKQFTKTDATSSFYIGPYVTFNGSSSSVVTVGTDVITIPNHNLGTGDSVIYSNGGGTTISTTGTALVSGNTYYVIRVSSNEVKLATSTANAAAGIAIDIIAVGSGTNHSLRYNGTDAVVNPTVEKYSGKIIFAEYRNALARLTDKEKFRFVLEF